MPISTVCHCSKDKSMLGMTVQFNMKAQDSSEQYTEYWDTALME